MSDQERLPLSASSASGAVLFLPESSFVVEREVLRYDWSDLVADVGGFLGLLLGFSLLDGVRAAERLCWAKKNGG